MTRRTSTPTRGDQQHVDPEVIALLALGEPVATTAEIGHLSACSACSEKLTHLVGATAIGRTALDVGPLADPDPRVWAAIHAELGLAADVSAELDRTRRTARNGGLAPHDGVRRDDVPGADDVPDVDVPDVTERTAAHGGSADQRTAPDRASGGRRTGAGRVGAGQRATDQRATDQAGPGRGPRPPRSRPRFPRPAAAVLAAVVVGLLAVGGAFGWQSLVARQDQVLATATLAAFPAWAGAGGSAVVEVLPDATRELRVTVDAETGGQAFREVWLITSDSSALVSLGVLEGTSGRFVIPDGIDLKKYDLVDVSQEPLDGDPAHSGDSIVRGALS